MKNPNANDQPVSGNASAPVSGSVSRAEIWKETCRLRDDAICAVNELSKHLEKVPDKPRMYKANRALHALWEIE